MEKDYYKHTVHKRKTTNVQIYKLKRWVFLEMQLSPIGLLEMIHIGHISCKGPRTLINSC